MNPCEIPQNSECQTYPNIEENQSSNVSIKIINKNDDNVVIRLYRHNKKNKRQHQRQSSGSDKPKNMQQPTMLRNIYRNTFGPTLDETLLVGMETMQLCQNSNCPNEKFCAEEDYPRNNSSNMSNELSWDYSTLLPNNSDVKQFESVCTNTSSRLLKQPSPTSTNQSQNNPSSNQPIENMKSTQLKEERNQANISSDENLSKHVSSDGITFSYLTDITNSTITDPKHDNNNTLASISTLCNTKDPSYVVSECSFADDTTESGNYAEEVGTQTEPTKSDLISSDEPESTSSYQKSKTFHSSRNDKETDSEVFASNLLPRSRNVKIKHRPISEIYRLNLNYKPLKMKKSKSYPEQLVMRSSSNHKSNYENITNSGSTTITSTIILSTLKPSECSLQNKQTLIVASTQFIQTPKHKKSTKKSKKGKYYINSEVVELYRMPYWERKKNYPTARFIKKIMECSRLHAGSDRRNQEIDNCSSSCSWLSHYSEISDIEKLQNSIRRGKYRDLLTSEYKALELKQVFSSSSSSNFSTTSSTFSSCFIYTAGRQRSGEAEGNIDKLSQTYDKLHLFEDDTPCEIPKTRLNHSDIMLPPDELLYGNKKSADGKVSQTPTVEKESSEAVFEATNHNKSKEKEPPGEIAVVTAAATAADAELTFGVHVGSEMQQGFDTVPDNVTLDSENEDDKITEANDEFNEALNRVKPRLSLKDRLQKLWDIALSSAMEPPGSAPRKPKKMGYGAVRSPQRRQYPMVEHEQKNNLPPYEQHHKPADLLYSKSPPSEVMLPRRNYQESRGRYPPTRAVVPKNRYSPNQSTPRNDYGITDEPYSGYPTRAIPKNDYYSKYPPSRLPPESTSMVPRKKFDSTDSQPNYETTRAMIPKRKHDPMIDKNNFESSGGSYSKYPPAGGTTIPKNRHAKALEKKYPIDDEFFGSKSDRPYKDKAYNVQPSTIAIVSKKENSKYSPPHTRKDGTRKDKELKDKKEEFVKYSSTGAQTRKGDSKTKIQSKNSDAQKSHTEVQKDTSRTEIEEYKECNCKNDLRMENQSMDRKDFTRSNCRYEECPCFTQTMYPPTEAMVTDKTYDPILDNDVSYAYHKSTGVIYTNSHSAGICPAISPDFQKRDRPKRKPILEKLVDAITDYSKSSKVSRKQTCLRCNRSSFHEDPLIKVPRRTPVLQKFIDTFCRTNARNSQSNICGVTPSNGFTKKENRRKFFGPNKNDKCCNTDCSKTESLQDFELNQANLETKIFTCFDNEVRTCDKNVCSKEMQCELGKNENFIDEEVVGYKSHYVNEYCETDDLVNRRNRQQQFSQTSDINFVCAEKTYCDSTCYTQEEEMPDDAEFEEIKKKFLRENRKDAGQNTEPRNQYEEIRKQFRNSNPKNVAQNTVCDNPDCDPDDCGKPKNIERNPFCNNPDCDNVDCTKPHFKKACPGSHSSKPPCCTPLDAHETCDKQVAITLLVEKRSTLPGQCVECNVKKPNPSIISQVFNCPVQDNSLFNKQLRMSAEKKRKSLEEENLKNMQRIEENQGKETDRKGSGHDDLYPDQSKSTRNKNKDKSSAKKGSTHPEKRKQASKKQKKPLMPRSLMDYGGVKEISPSLMFKKPTTPPCDSRFVLQPLLKNYERGCPKEEANPYCTCYMKPKVMDAEFDFVSFRDCTVDPRRCARIAGGSEVRTNMKYDLKRLQKKQSKLWISSSDMDLFARKYDPRSSFKNPSISHQSSSFRKPHPPPNRPFSEGCEKAQIGLCNCCANGNISDGLMRNNMPQETRYAITRVTKYDDYTTYEILKSTKARPRKIPEVLEKIFVEKDH